MIGHHLPGGTGRQEALVLSRDGRLAVLARGNKVRVLTRLRAMRSSRSIQPVRTSAV